MNTVNVCLLGENSGESEPRELMHSDDRDDEERNEEAEPDPARLDPRVLVVALLARDPGPPSPRLLRRSDMR